MTRETATEMTLRRAQDDSATASKRVAWATAHRIAVLDELAAEGIVDADKAKAEADRFFADAVLTVQILDNLSVDFARVLVRDAVSAARARAQEAARAAARAARQDAIRAAGHRVCRRCDGRGLWSTYHGNCFRCDGSGVDPRDD